MFIVISGKQGAGKTTLTEGLATRLRGKRIPNLTMNFADPIAQLHQAVYAVARSFGIHPPENGEADGALFQLLGTEWGRNTKGQDVWVNALKHKIQDVTAKWGEEFPIHVILIGDCRFKNEFEAFPEALKIRLECDRDVRRSRAKKWRDKEDHQSEIDLDDYVKEGAFDKVYDSDKMSSEAIADDVMAHFVERMNSVFKRE